MQVAIKKVLQDKRFKNRELQIMRMTAHTNIVQLKHCFYTTTPKDEVPLPDVVSSHQLGLSRHGKPKCWCHCSWCWGWASTNIPHGKHYSQGHIAQPESDIAGGCRCS